MSKFKVFACLTLFFCITIQAKAITLCGFSPENHWGFNQIIVNHTDKPWNFIVGPGCKDAGMIFYLLSENGDTNKSTTYNLYDYKVNGGFYTLPARSMCKVEWYGTSKPDNAIINIVSAEEKFQLKFWHGHDKPFLPFVQPIEAVGMAIACALIDLATMGTAAPVNSFICGLIAASVTDVLEDTTNLPHWVDDTVGFIAGFGSGYFVGKVIGETAIEEELGEAFDQKYPSYSAPTHDWNGVRFDCGDLGTMTKNFFRGIQRFTAVEFEKMAETWTESAVMSLLQEQTYTRVLETLGDLEMESLEANNSSGHRIYLNLMTSSDTTTNNNVFDFDISQCSDQSNMEWGTGGCFAKISVLWGPAFNGGATNTKGYSCTAGSLMALYSTATMQEYWASLFAVSPSIRTGSYSGAIFNNSSRTLYEVNYSKTDYDVYSLPKIPKNIFGTSSTKLPSVSNGVYVKMPPPYKNMYCFCGNDAMFICTTNGDNLTVYNYLGCAPGSIGSSDTLTPTNLESYGPYLHLAISDYSPAYKSCKASTSYLLFFFDLRNPYMYSNQQSFAAGNIGGAFTNGNLGAYNSNQTFSPVFTASTCILPFDECLAPGLENGYTIPNNGNSNLIYTIGKFYNNKSVQSYTYNLPGQFIHALPCQYSRVICYDSNSKMYQIVKLNKDLSIENTCNSFTAMNPQSLVYQTKNSLSSYDLNSNGSIQLETLYITYENQKLIPTGVVFYNNCLLATWYDPTKDATALLKIAYNGPIQTIQFYGHKFYTSLKNGKLFVGNSNTQASSLYPGSGNYSPIKATGKKWWLFSDMLKSCANNSVKWPSNSIFKSPPIGSASNAVPAPKVNVDSNNVQGGGLWLSAGTSTKIPVQITGIGAPFSISVSLGGKNYLKDGTFDLGTTSVSGNTITYNAPSSVNNKDEQGNIIPVGMNDVWVNVTVTDSAGNSTISSITCCVTKSHKLSVSVDNFYVNTGGSEQIPFQVSGGTKPYTVSAEITGQNWLQNGSLDIGSTTVESGVIVNYEAPAGIYDYESTSELQTRTLTATVTVKDAKGKTATANGYVYILSNIYNTNSNGSLTISAKNIFLNAGERKEIPITVTGSAIPCYQLEAKLSGENWLYLPEKFDIGSTDANRWDMKVYYTAPTQLCTWDENQAVFPSSRKFTATITVVENSGKSVSVNTNIYVQAANFSVKANDICIQSGTSKIIPLKIVGGTPSSAAVYLKSNTGKVLKTGLGSVKTSGSTITYTAPSGVTENETVTADIYITKSNNENNSPVITTLTSTTITVTPPLKVLAKNLTLKESSQETIPVTVTGGRPPYKVTAKIKGGSSATDNGNLTVSGTTATYTAPSKINSDSKTVTAEITVNDEAGNSKSIDVKIDIIDFRVKTSNINMQEGTTKTIPLTISGLPPYKVTASLQQLGYFGDGQQSGYGKLTISGTKVSYTAPTGLKNNYQETVNITVADANTFKKTVSSVITIAPKLVVNCKAIEVKVGSEAVLDLYISGGNPPYKVTTNLYTNNYNLDYSRNPGTIEPSIAEFTKSGYESLKYIAPDILYNTHNTVKSTTVEANFTITDSFENTAKAITEITVYQ